MALRMRETEYAGKEIFIGTIRDITDAREAEREIRQAKEEYQQLVDSATDVVWKMDAEGTMVFVNPACESIYGVRPEEIIGKDFRRYIHPESLEQAEEDLNTVLAGNDLVDLDRVHQDVDGTPKRVACSARPVRDVRGNVVGAQGVFRDVTVRVAAREALEQARQAAEDHAASKSAFLANMSHEIRTPMNGVLGMLELLLDTELTEYQRESIDVAVSSGEALLTILNDILDVSKIEAGLFELEDIPFDLPRMVDMATRTLRLRAAERTTELHLDIHSDVPTTVRGDPGRLRQVLTNLLSNAIKFTEGGEITVSLGTEGSVNGKTKVRFGVQDTGIGIPQDKLEAIFEEFAQADASITRTHGGTGLGLSISRRIVALLGGEINVTSEVGVGSEFWFVVAFEKVDQPLRARQVTDPGGPHNRRFLVVDDNATARRIVREAVESGGNTADEAESADLGLAMMREAAKRGQPYDAAIIDGAMPDKDGFDMAMDVQGDPAIAGTNLLMLTSSMDVGGHAKARKLGIRGYLTKPVSRTALLSALQRVLEWKDRGGGAERRLVTQSSLELEKKPYKVLLAEDNKVNQQIAEAMLGKFGHDVDIVDNGRAAVEAVQTKAYDVILMDIQMPELDGLEATREIRALGGYDDLPIVALTAHALAEERERCMDAGMTGFLTKPFKGHQIQSAIEEAVRQRGHSGETDNGQ